MLYLTVFSHRLLTILCQQCCRSSRGFTMCQLWAAGRGTVAGPFISPYDRPSVAAINQGETQNRGGKSERCSPACNRPVTYSVTCDLQPKTTC